MSSSTPFTSSQPRTQIAIGLGLALVMLLTRSHHFGTAFTPPDASLAIFFLAGMWIASGWAFVGLLVVAALADQLAFAVDVSSWCVTAAYSFLIPAYGAMWLGGKLCRTLDLGRVRDVALLATTVIVGAAVYFLISNGSFELLSGYFDGMSIGEYWSRTIGYFPWYLGWAAAYIATGVLGAMTVKLLRGRSSSVVATR